MKIVTPESIPYEYCSHSRNSEATYFDASGDMAYADVDELRFTHNTETQAFEGVLIEPERTNYVTNSSVKNNETFNVNVSVTGDEFGGTAIVSFYGGGTLTLTGPGLPSGGITISGTLGDFSRAFAAFPHENGTYTFSFSGIGRYVQYEIAPYPVTNNESTFDGIYIDGRQPDSDDISTPDYIASLQRPTSWIPTSGSPATRAADVLDGYGIIDSTLTESAAEYDPETEYALGDEVLVGIDVYESATDNNIGNDPETSQEWFRVRTSNEFAFLDLERGGRSSADTLRFAVRLPEMANSATLVDFTAGTVAACVSRTVRDTQDNAVAVYRSAFIDAGMELPTSVFVGDITDSRVTERHVEFSGDIVSVELRHPDQAELGELVFGNAFDAGDTQLGLSTGIIDFSRKDTDEFGNFEITRRRFSKRMEMDVWVDKDNYNAVLRRLYALRARPTVWVGTDLIDFAEGGIAFGYYRDFNIVISYPTYTVLSIEVETLA